MDDPLFDPWGGDETPARARRPPKWRAPDTVLPAAFRRRSSEVEHAAARLGDAAAFLRAMAAPRLADVAFKLHLARHDASFEDRLDAVPPALGLRVRPRPGPFDRRAARGWQSLQLVLDEASNPREPEVVLRRWSEDTANSGTEERIPANRVGAAWLEARVLDFLDAVLNGA